MIALQVEVPITSFRQSRAREYAETYPVPPPATVYGMLLALVGEVDRSQYIGTRLALGMLSHPKKSTVIRTFRRFKTKELAAGVNARPDYQELLTEVRFLVCVDLEDTLGQRLQAAFRNPETIDRFGGLSLGESRDLVNSLRRVDPAQFPPSVRWIVQDEDGLLALPIWVDHVGSRGTRWLRYTLTDQETPANPPAEAWTIIHPERQ